MVLFFDPYLTTHQSIYKCLIKARMTLRGNFNHYGNFSYLEFKLPTYYTNLPLFTHVGLLPLHIPRT